MPDGLPRIRSVLEAGLVPLFPSHPHLTFSDGSTEAMPVAWASIRLEAETKEGFVFLSERSEEVLLGIHFLRVFNKTLTFSLERGSEIIFVAEESPKVASKPEPSANPGTPKRTRSTP